MTVYRNYIELSPGYESVVDESIELRQKDFWKKYIVHEDMAKALDCICRSLKPASPDDQRSFWFHGAYGTGKSYSALVLKHLFEDPIEEIEDFLSRPLLRDNKERFLSIRKKGSFLTVWKSGGCDTIINANRLMMEMENSIRNTLDHKLGDKAYFGRNSLIEAVKDALNDKSINWQNIFDDPAYLIGSDYPSLDEFRELVMSNDLKACEMASQVIIEKGWGLFSNVEQFKDWIIDIIQGNNLEETGLVFIWDEFTEYLKQSKDMNVLQALSEFCKQYPFYMIFIVHRDSAWVEDFGQASYEHMVHRYHELEFFINEGTAYRLIGDSIITRPGMEDAWKQIQQDLMDSIRHKIPEYEGLELENKQDNIKELLPIHPMTLTLLSKVAGNFAASQRTLFRFLKDVNENNEEVGFQYYINKFGPDNWRWLTPDFLWDYFFMRDSDVRDFGEEAKACFRHYTKNENLINDKRALAIFKAAMLLIAIHGSSHNIFIKQRHDDKKIKPSLNVLVNCFAGIISEEEVKELINELQNIDMLMTIKDGQDYRIEKPYDISGSGGDIKKKKEAEIKKYTPYVLLSNDGILTKSIKDQFIDMNKAISKRILVEPCSADTNSLKARLGNLKEKLEKQPYKFGILLVVPSSTEQFHKTEDALQEYSKNEETKRLVFVMLKKPLDERTLDEWYENRAHHLLSVDAGQAASADQYKVKSEEIMATWVSTAIGAQMIAYYNGTLYPSIFGKNDLARLVENDMILKIFYAAPEKVVKVSTLYRPAQERAALAAISKSTDENKQIMNLVDAVKAAKVWDINSIDDFITENVADNTKAIGLLAELIKKNFTNNVKTNLQELWEEIQQPPFGYYDTMACSYILGFIMRFYANTSYCWFDGTNPNILTPQNLATMIYKMCKNNVEGNSFSAGSETGRRFREYTQRIFDLSTNEVANEEQTRKSVRAKISKIAVPFWTIKYIPEHKYGSSEMKETAIKLADKYSDFIKQVGDQEALMGDILELGKGKGPLREAIKTLLNDKVALNEGFQNYIKQVNSELNEIAIKAGFSSNDLFDSIKLLMQEEVYTWTEEQVAERLNYLQTDLKLISYMNKVMNTERKTLEKIREDLSNRFEQMKMPGIVLEDMGETWGDALILLRDISQNKWQGWSLEEKDKALEVLNEQAKDVWDNITDSRAMLKKYLSNIGYEHASEDIEKIYNSLEYVFYNSSKKSFENNLLEKRRKLNYEKDKLHLINLWKEKTDTRTVKDWCNKYSTPILWVIEPEKAIVAEVLISVQNDNIVDPTLLKNAINILEGEDFDYLKDEVYINKCFFMRTDEKYLSIISNRLMDLQDYLKKKLGGDVYNWANNYNEVRKMIENYIKENLRQDVIVKAQNNIEGMDESFLKKKIKNLMEENPDLCMLFLKE